MNDQSTHNLVHSTRFTLHFPGYESIAYHTQGVSIPGLTLGISAVPSPGMAMTYGPGSSMEFDVLSINFLVDENLENWKSIWTWMISMSPAIRFSDYRTRIGVDKTERFKNTFANATLLVLTNSNIPNIEVNFRNVWPYSLASLDFNASNSDEGHFLSTATFRYDYYYFS